MAAKKKAAIVGGKAAKPRVYTGPKPRPYSGLSKADKAREGAQNERDLAGKKNGKPKKRK